MLKNKLVLGALAVLSISSSVAFAAQPQVPRPLENLVQLGAASIVRAFPAPDGLQGYLIDQRGQYEVLFGLNGYLLVGGLISPQGANMTQTLYQQYAPKPDYSSVAAAVMRDKYVIHVGHAGPSVIAFVDPNCIFCHKLYKTFAPEVAAGKLRVTYVPVGFLKPSSEGKAAAILQSPNPAAALNYDEAHFNDAVEEGGIKPAKPTSAVSAALQSHMTEMQSLHSSGTPTLLYQTKAGQWTAQMGMPQNMAAFLSGVR